MVYPMAYDRVMKRNFLTGDYSKTFHHNDARENHLAGDLRRLEKDTMDQYHLEKYAALAKVEPDQVRIIFAAFFAGFMGLVPFDYSKR